MSESQTKEPTSGNEQPDAMTFSNDAQKDIDAREAKLKSYEVPEESRQKEVEQTPSTRIVGTTDSYSVYEGNEQVAGPFKTRQEAFEANQKHREGGAEKQGNGRRKTAKENEDAERAGARTGEGSTRSR